MTRRLLLSYLTVTLLVLLLLELPLAIFYSQRELERFTADVERDASVLATIYEDTLESGQTPDVAAAQSYRLKTGARVVVVDDRGVSVVDTELPPPRDFSTRPEVATALTGVRAAGSRYSNTVGADLVYVAVPVASSGQVHGALRVTLSAAEVDARVHRFWIGLVVIAVIVLLMMALIGGLIARSIAWPIRRLDDTARRYASGDLAPPADAGPPEVRRLGATMGVMAERLDAMLEEQRSFVADASHQLRTPLTAPACGWRTCSREWRRAAPSEPATPPNWRRRSTRRPGSDLVTELLQLARAEEGRASEPSTSPRWSAIAPTPGPRSPTRPASGWPSRSRAGRWRSAVPGAVEQILDNSLDNAVLVSPRGATVTVRIVPDDAQVRLVVADEGPGLSDEDKVRATRRFWRARPDHSGTGLGLAIAEALARGSGGSLHLEDARPGAIPPGLAVVVVLPAGRR
ncbi:MAG: HAMP domain-containing sensor histidine kinase [Ilumatobacteraceae bacterium]